MTTDTDCGVISVPSHGPERRRAARFPRVFAAAVRTQDGVEYGCATRDISTAGVFFYCAAEFAEQSAVELVMTLPLELTCGETQWMRAEATVVRVEPDPSASGRYGIAARIEQLEFIPELYGLGHTEP